MKVFYLLFYMNKFHIIFPESFDIGSCRWGFIENSIVQIQNCTIYTPAPVWEANFVHTSLMFVLVIILSVFFLWKPFFMLNAYLPTFPSDNSSTSDTIRFARVALETKSNILNSHIWKHFRCAYLWLNNLKCFPSSDNNN